MAKDEPPSKKARKAPPPKGGGGEDVTRGKSHAELVAQRKSLREEVRGLPAEQRDRVFAHYHSSERADLSRARLRHLRQDDKNADHSGLTPYQARNLQKRRGRSHKNMALRRQMDRREAKRLQNAMEAADAEEILHAHSAGLVEAENDMEKTIQLTQQQLKHGEFLDENVRRNIFDLELGDYAPYKVRYDRSGRHALLAGRGGHVSVIDQHTMALRNEFHLHERVRDACFLHDGSMMAVSQERNVYVYDGEGAEVHRMEGHRRVGGMEFLPYHWLLGEFDVRVKIRFADDGDR